MSDPTVAGWVTAAAGVAAPVAVALGAFWTTRGREEGATRSEIKVRDSAQKVLNDANRETILGLQTENARLRDNNERRQAGIDLWERRARRAYEVAHVIQRMLADIVVATNRQDVVPRIPELEDPL